MADIFLVFGGTVSDPRGNEFRDPAELHFVGFYGDRPAAIAAWRGASQRAIDDAECKFLILNLSETYAKQPALGSA